MFALNCLEDLYKATENVVNVTEVQPNFNIPIDTQWKRIASDRDIRDWECYEIVIRIKFKATQLTYIHPLNDFANNLGEFTE